MIYLATAMQLPVNFRATQQSKCFTALSLLSLRGWCDIEDNTICWSLQTASKQISINVHTNSLKKYKMDSSQGKIEHSSGQNDSHAQNTENGMEDLANITEEDMEGEATISFSKLFIKSTSELFCIKIFPTCIVFFQFISIKRLYWCKKRELLNFSDLP